MIRLLMICLIFTCLIACSKSAHTYSGKVYNFAAGIPTNITLSNSMKTLDEAIYEHDYIVLATLDKVESVRGGELYKISVVEQYKGRDDLQGEQLDYYSVVRIKEVGEQYLLFLRERNVTHHPSTNYGSGIYPNLIVDGKFQDGPFTGESFKDIVKQIKGSSQLNEYKNPIYEINESAENLNELIKLSDHIVHINVLEVTQINEFTTSVSATVLGQFRSEQPYEEHVSFIIPTFDLTNKVKVGDEYLLFQAFTPTVDGEELLPTTRFGSVICKQDSSEWNEVISLLSK